MRGRESARVRGKTPDGSPMEDPEEAFNRKRQGLGGMEGLQPMEMVGSRTPSRLSGDVAMAASNTSADGTLRLRKVV